MSKPVDRVMLFAAGFGTRMAPLTDDRPKPLIPVAGRALVDHTLDLVDDLKPKRVVINTHYKAQMMAAHLAGRDIVISHETPDILDTGGGLRAALEMLGTGPVLTSNTDAIWAGPNPMPMLRDAWDPDRMDALLMCIPLAQTIGRAGQGDFTTDATGKVVSRGPEMVYGGVQILKTDLLQAVPDPVFSLNVIWTQMQAQGRLFTLTYPGQWCDVGTPDGIALAETLLESHHV